MDSTEMAPRETSCPLVLSEEQWNEIAPVLHVEKQRKKSGRPRRGDRMLFEGVLWLLLNHEQWSSLPTSYGPKSTCHARFREWMENGALTRVWPRVVEMAPVMAEVHWDALFSGQAATSANNRRGPVAIRRVGMQGNGADASTHAA